MDHLGDKIWGPDSPLTRGEIYYHLMSRLPRDEEKLMALVDRSRRESGEGDRVTAAGVVSLSSICVRSCLHCGFRAERSESERFRLGRSEVIAAGERAHRSGVKWLILKSGDDPGLSADMVAELSRDLCSRFDFRLTLALGERSDDVYASLKHSGIHSYWLNHETCDPHIYRRIRPAMYWVDRLRGLETLKELNFALGSGILLGVPNQTYENLMDDLALLMDPQILALIVEPFLPPPECPGHDLVQRPENIIVAPEFDTMRRVIAVLKILRPRARIMLSNSHVKNFHALERPGLFQAGANGLLLDFTPVDFGRLAHQTPFIGTRIEDPEQLEQLRERLAEMKLTLDFTPPF